MADFVIGERRHEPRADGEAVPRGYSIAAPGLRVVDVVDVSASGVRLRTASILRPGRCLTVRQRSDAQRAEQFRVATVVRCSVHRLGRSGVTFEAALHLLPVDAGHPPA